MKKGMALVTVVTVIVILAILSTAMVTSAVESINNAKLYNFANEVKMVNDFIEAYKVDNDGKLPLDTLVYRIDVYDMTKEEVDKIFPGESCQLYDGAYCIANLSMINLDELGLQHLKTDIEREGGGVYVRSNNTGRVFLTSGRRIGGKLYFGLTDELKKMIGMSTDEDYNSALKDGIAMYRSPSTPTKEGVSTEIKIPNVSTSGMDIEVNSVRMVETNTNISLATDGDYKVAIANPTKSYKGAYHIEVVYSYKQTGGTEKITYTVSNSDVTAPTITYDKVDFEYNIFKRKYNIALTGLNIRDTGTGVKTVKYIDGNLEDEDIKEVITAVGEEIDVNNYKILAKSEIFILYVEDFAGNYTYERIANVSNKEKKIIPKISSNMTPVKFRPSGNLDMPMATTSEDPEWFDYDDKKWANAKTKDGSLWVWIPRFAYKILAPGTEVESPVSVILLKGNTNQYVDDSGEIRELPRGYIVHPAFTNEISSLYANGGSDKEISGFWVSKFEAGYAGLGDVSGYTKYNTQTSYRTTNNIKNVYGNITKFSTKMPYPVFINKAISYNNIALGDACNLGLELNRTGNPYGIPGSADTHITKNSEWGAVVYLASSKYGNSNVSSNVKIASSSYTNSYSLTGYNSEVLSYNSLTSGVSSTTTGNATGVADMTGGCAEFMSAHIKNKSGNIKKYAPSFTENSTDISTKHKTVYSFSSADNSLENFREPVNKVKTGDAIFETSNGVRTWKEGFITFPNKNNPFFIRGGDRASYRTNRLYTVEATTGAPAVDISFRCVIAFN